MIVFGSSLSPFVRKVLVIAAEKGVEVENRVGRPGQPTEEFLACSPYRKIPALQDGDFRISDSSAIAHYIEALHPDPALIPAEPRARARTIWFDEFADTLMVASGAKLFFNRIVAPLFLGRDGDEETAAAAERDEMPRHYDYLEGVVPDSGFLVGDGLTLADIAVASPFVNMMHLNAGPDPARWPKTTAYVARILARPSFQRLIEAETALIAQARAAQGASR